MRRADGAIPILFIKLDHTYVTGHIADLDN